MSQNLMKAVLYHLKGIENWVNTSVHSLAAHTRGLSTITYISTNDILPPMCLADVTNVSWQMDESGRSPIVLWQRSTTWLTMSAWKNHFLDFCHEKKMSCALYSKTSPEEFYGRVFCTVLTLLRIFCFQCLSSILTISNIHRKDVISVFCVHLRTQTKMALVQTI